LTVETHSPFPSFPDARTFWNATKLLVETGVFWLFLDLEREKVEKKEIFWFSEKIGDLSRIVK
jgi:hypothetical protein